MKVDMTVELVVYLLKLVQCTGYTIPLTYLIADKHAIRVMAILSSFVHTLAS